MIDKNNLKDTIEFFVKGKLTEPTLSEFKNMMANDKSLMNEVDLQSITMQAIKENRIKGLKARLENLNVSNFEVNNPATSNLIKYFSAKSIGLAMAIVGVGVGAYLFTQNQIDSSNIASNDVSIQDSVGQDNIVENNQASSELSLSNAENVADIEEIVSLEKAKNSDKSIRTEKKYTRNSISANKLKVASGKRTAANGEEMLTQKFDDGSDAEISTNIPQIPVSNTSEEKALHASDVDIKSINDGKHNFHYMLKESTLFLYGNFDASPYEILEFNDENGQSFYLYYDQSFFTLKNGQTEPVKLKKISDTKLLQSLVAARNKKH